MGTAQTVRRNASIGFVATEYTRRGRVAAFEKPENSTAAGIKRTFSPYTRNRRGADRGHGARLIVARESNHEKRASGRIAATSTRTNQIIKKTGIDEGGCRS